MMDPSLDENEGAGFGNFFAHIPAIIWARRWWIVVPFVLSAIAAMAAVLLVPAAYKSSALMLVQSPQLPGGVLDQSGSEIIDRRIARIRQQVTSRPDLVSLIQRHGLYSQERDNKPLSDIISEMRSSIALSPTTVDLPGNRADQQTIAFELAFTYEDPVLAQAVAQDLMDKILELDASGNVEQATNTEQFLVEQAHGLDEQMKQVQAQIAAVNAQYGGVLTSSGVIMGGGGGSYDVQIAALQRDNANLINQKNVAQSSDTRDPVVVGAETALAAARAMYSDTHPDVILARQRLREAQELAKNNTKKLPLDTIDQQIAFNNSQIAALRAAKAQDDAQLRAQVAARAQAPIAQQQVDYLQQKLQGLSQQYQNVQARLMAARAGVKAEDEQLAERLSVVEPPIVPDKPSWPNRLLILAAGLGGGLALGFLVAFGVELILRPIRDPGALTAITGNAPLGMVPVIINKKQKQRKRKAA